MTYVKWTWIVIITIVISLLIFTCYKINQGFARLHNDPMTKIYMNHAFDEQKKQAEDTNKPPK